MDNNNHTFRTTLRFTSRQAQDLPVSVQFDHQPAEKQTKDYPGCQAEVTLCKVSIDITQLMWEVFGFYTGKEREYLIEQTRHAEPVADLLPVLDKLSQTSLRASCWEYLEILGGYDDDR